MLSHCNMIFIYCEREARWLMEFHPDKCDAISVTRKKHPTLHPYYTYGHLLQHVDHVKYLGVNIISDLRWDKLVDIICNKANSALGFIRRSNALLTLATLRSRLWHINVMYAQSWSIVLRCGTHIPLVLPGSWSRYKEERHVILWVGIGAPQV